VETPAKKRNFTQTSMQALPQGSDTRQRWCQDKWHLVRRMPRYHRRWRSRIPWWTMIRIWIMTSTHRYQYQGNMRTDSRWGWHYLCEVCLGTAKEDWRTDTSTRYWVCEECGMACKVSKPRDKTPHGTLWVTNGESLWISLYSHSALSVSMNGIMRRCTGLDYHQTKDLMDSELFAGVSAVDAYMDKSQKKGKWGIWIVARAETPTGCLHITNGESLWK